MKQLFKPILLYFVFAIANSYAQFNITINNIQAKVRGNLLCAYEYGELGDSSFTYLKLNKDSVFVDLLTKKNGKYIDWTSGSSALSSIDPLLSRVMDVGLNDHITKAGIVQLICSDYKKNIFYRMVDDKRDTTFYDPSINLICCSLNDAVFRKWQIARLINPTIPNREVIVERKDKFSIPAIPLFFTREKDRYGEYHTNHWYYEVKNDSLYCYRLYDLDEWSGNCGFITIEKAPLPLISKANMVVRKVRSDEYSQGPEKDQYAVAVGTLGKFIVTDYYNNGKDKYEIQKAMMLIICSSKEMADQVFKEILLAK